LEEITMKVRMEMFVFQLRPSETRATSLLSRDNELGEISPLAGAERTVGSEGSRLARYFSLEEFVGLVFGVMTVLYIVFSLASLK
jgi:hypothetical protein